MWNVAVQVDLADLEGCWWPVIGCCPEPLDQTQEMWTKQAAVEVLWAASGRHLGLCVSTERPIPPLRRCVPSPTDAWALVAGRSAGLDPWAGSTVAEARCRQTIGYPSVELEHQPVVQVREVIIDGAPLAPSAYRLWRGDLLRVDGEQWPTRQDLAVDGDVVGGWQVTVVHGIPVPVGGQVAAGVYACEMGKALAGDEECKLPRRVQTVTRAGVSMAFVDPMQFLADGLTGVYEIDAWLRAVNPGKLTRSAQVYSAPALQRRGVLRW